MVSIDSSIRWLDTKLSSNTTSCICPTTSSCREISIHHIQNAFITSICFHRHFEADDQWLRFLSRSTLVANSWISWFLVCYWAYVFCWLELVEIGQKSLYLLTLKLVDPISFFVVFDFLWRLNGFHSLLCTCSACPTGLFEEALLLAWSATSFARWSNFRARRSLHCLSALALVLVSSLWPHKPLKSKLEARTVAAINFK